MRKIKTTYKKLYDLYGGGNHEEAYEVTDRLFVKSSSLDLVPIQYVVTKHNHPIIRIDLEDDLSFECSEKHLFSYERMSVYADDATTIDTIYGQKKVLEKTPLGEESVYDISIPAPHWYITSEKNGIIHHNTFFAISAIKAFQLENPTGQTLFFDSESTMNSKFLERRGIDHNRVLIIPVPSLEKFRSHVTKIFQKYLTNEGEKPKLMIVLDSLGNIPSEKEIKDALNDNEVVDFTRSKIIRSIFRILTPQLQMAKCPMIVTNHTYDNPMSLYGGPEMSGGGGLKYIASSIIFLSKKKDKDAPEEGNSIILTAKVKKSRFTKPDMKAELRLDFNKGLDKYYGLLDFAEEAGVFKKVSTKFELPNGKTYFGKAINNADDPTYYYTDETLKKIEEYAKKNMQLGDNS